MYREEEIQIRRALVAERKRGTLDAGKRLIFFGAGDYSRGIIDILKGMGNYDFIVVDNDKNKNGTYCKNVKVSLPGDIAREIWEESVVVICSHFREEMKKQAIALGALEKNVVVIHLDTFEERVFCNISSVIKGRKIYRRIKNKYPGYHYLLCPYTGTGDIYLIGSLLKYYIEKEHIEKYVLIVVSRSCEKVADIFGIDNIEVIGGSEECRYLTRYYVVCPNECDIKILNDSWGNIYTDPVQWFRGLHGMNFAIMFKKFVFDIPDRYPPVHPDFPDKKREIDEIAKKHGMLNGRSVLVAPYSTTLAELPRTFWERLAVAMVKMGYKPYTNLGVRDDEAICGTEGVFIPLDIAPQMVSWMGCFIGTRSGLCDVVSGASAKKIIIYDSNNMFFNVSAYEYFSLRKTGLSDDAVELSYDGINIDKLLTAVLESL